MNNINWKLPATVIAAACVAIVVYSIYTQNKQNQITDADAVQKDNKKMDEKEEEKENEQNKIADDNDNKTDQKSQTNDVLVDDNKTDQKLQKKDDYSGYNDRFPVKVFVRMRPLVGLEITENHQSMKYSVKKLKKKNKYRENLILKKVSGLNNKRDKKFTGFRKIILPDYNNINIFNKYISATCTPYIFNGDKICIFAYGHTGSGKTHTMFGYKNKNIPGMYQLFAEKLFNDDRIKNDNNIFIEIRFVELYQNKLYDLLSPNKNECFLREDSNGIIQLRGEMEKDNNGKIRAKAVTAIAVSSVNELLNVVSDGISARNVGKSTLHDKSSRSHAFLEFEIVSSDLINMRNELIDIDGDILLYECMMDTESIEQLLKRYKKKELIPPNVLKLVQFMDNMDYNEKQKYSKSGYKLNKRKKEKLISDLNKFPFNDNKICIGGTTVFVDLAGNEYGRDNKNNTNRDIQQQRERIEINKSLLSLKECIRALHKNKTYIAYRSSKLTMYLRRYLNGINSKAIMISNIGRSQNYSKQTINTLKYSELVAKA